MAIPTIARQLLVLMFPARTALSVRAMLEAECKLAPSEFKGTGAGHLGDFIKLADVKEVAAICSGYIQWTKRVAKKMDPQEQGEFEFYRKAPDWLLRWMTPVDPKLCSYGNTSFMAMRDATSGFCKPKVMDLKMGFKTTSKRQKGFVGEYGGAYRDRSSISRSIGFRLEGMSGRPEEKSTLMQKVPKTILNMYFEGLDNETLRKRVAKLEEQLGGLLEESSVWPAQKWVGSSLLIVMEEADEVECSQTEGLKVYVIDFGRSHLTVAEPNVDEYSAKDKNHWKKYWAYYRGGLLRLYYEVWHWRRCVVPDLAPRTDFLEDMALSFEVPYVECTTMGCNVYQPRKPDDRSKGERLALPSCDAVIQPGKPVPSPPVLRRPSCSDLVAAEPLASGAGGDVRWLFMHLKRTTIKFGSLPMIGKTNPSISGTLFDTAVAVPSNMCGVKAFTPRFSFTCSLSDGTEMLMIPDPLEGEGDDNNTGMLEFKLGLYPIEKHLYECADPVDGDPTLVEVNVKGYSLVSQLGLDAVSNVDGHPQGDVFQHFDRVLLGSMIGQILELLYVLIPMPPQYWPGVSIALVYQGSDAKVSFLDPACARLDEDDWDIWQLRHWRAFQASLTSLLADMMWAYAKGLSSDALFQELSKWMEVSDALSIKELHHKGDISESQELAEVLHLPYVTCAEISESNFEGCSVYDAENQLVKGSSMPTHADTTNRHVDRKIMTQAGFGKKPENPVPGGHRGPRGPYNPYAHASHQRLENRFAPGIRQRPENLDANGKLSPQAQRRSYPEK